MVEIKLFEDASIFNLDFVPNRDAFPLVIITPSPQAADEIRQKIIKTGQIKVPDVITISKFVKDQLSEMPDKPTLLNKAKLLLIGASLWKFYLGEKSEKPIEQELFFKAFSLFTELRGYSLEANLIKPLLEEYPADLRGFILYFYQVMQDLNYFDEHKAYKKIADIYRQIDFEQEMKTYLFWDFTYMSGSQIDMINALGIRNQVMIPYELEIYQKTISSDWIRWFLPESNLKCVDKPKKILKVVEFPKKKLNLNLKKFPISDNSEILLCTKKISQYEIFDLPFDQYFFKTSNSIFESELKLLQTKLLEKTKNLTKIKTSSVSEEIGQEITSLLAQNEKNFRRIKVLTDFIQLLQEYFNLSDYNHSLTSFDFQVLFEVLELNLPRTFFAPVVYKSKGQLVDLSRVQSIDTNNQIIVCGTSDYAPLKLSEDVFPEKVFEILSTLGPVKRNGLDFLITQKRLQDILQIEKTVLFLENNLAKHDLGWSEILRSFDIERLTTPRVPNKFPKLKFERANSISKLKTISPTRLQTYLDCPQKYYYQYIEKIKIDLDLKSTIQNNEIGIIEHKVIEEYLKRYEEYQDEQLSDLCSSLLNAFLQKENRKLSRVEFNQVMTEIELYSRQAITYLLSLKSIDSSIRFEFEKKLNGSYEGLELDVSVDCIVYFSNGYAILDFKRSNSSIPSKKDIFEHEKIQILFYLKFLFENDPNVLFYGYLNLSDLNSSLILNHDADFLEKYNQNHLNELVQLSPIKENLEDIKSNFDLRFNDLVNSLKADTVFSIKPIHDDVCRFCQLKSVCPRQEVSNGQG